MRAPLILPLLAGVAGLAVATAADAGGCASACTTCCLPSVHNIQVPGVTVTPPNIVISPPSIMGGVGGLVDVGVQVSTSTEASAAATASTASYASSVTNAQAANLLAATSTASVGGNGYFSEGGSSANIPSLIVESGATEKVCLEHTGAFRAVAIQAVCLDDKAVPHPASQTSPDRDVGETFEGELFRCIAGAHMQYVVADWAGAAHFDHGQTVVCEKNEALWRGHDGRLQCRAQAPARDCNERSLLRRFGAGIKVVKAVGAEQCVSWGTRTVAAQSAGQSFAMDGGVGP